MRIPWHRIAVSSLLVALAGCGPVSRQVRSVGILDAPSESDPAGVALTADLPVVTMCQPGEFRVTAGKSTVDGANTVAYACAGICSAADWRECAVCAAGECRLQMVVDGMGAWLDVGEAAAGAETIVYVPGGGATARQDPKYLAPYRLAGARVVELTFAAGVAIPLAVKKMAESFPAGWFSRTSSPAANLRIMSARPAALIRWAHDHLSNNARFATVGCSGGSVATFSSVFWHGLDPIVDYQWWGGGPYFDMSYACGAGPSRYEVNDLAQSVGIPIDRLIDHMHGTRDVCTKDKGSKAFEASSPRLGGGTWTLTHPVDIASSQGMASDAMLGIFSHAKSVADNVKADKTFTAEPGTHCMAHAVSSCKAICARFLHRPCNCDEAVLDSDL